MMKISVKMCRKRKRVKSKWGRTRDLIIELVSRCMESLKIYIFTIAL